MNKRIAFSLAVVALSVSACAPDPSDVYSAGEDAPPATLGALPTTTIAEGDAEPVGTFPPNGDTVEVRSLDNTFIEAQIEIEAGTEVSWVNGGRNDHNVLPVDESLEWGVGRDDFVPGDTYAHVFDTPGVYPYYCSIHGTQDVGMVGAVVVTAPS